MWSAPRLEAADLVTGLVMATAVPLCLLQVPYATLIPQTTGDTSAVLYAVSLALPFAAAAPLAVLAVRRLRGWLVLLAGLVVIVTGGLAASTIHVGEIWAAAALAGAVAGAATALEKQVRIVRRGDARAGMSRVSPSPDFGVAGSLLAAAALGVAGYLAAGAITMQLGETQTAASAASPQGALVTALSWLELACATAALMVVTAGPGLGRARRAARRARAHG